MANEVYSCWSYKVASIMVLLAGLVALPSPHYSRAPSCVAIVRTKMSLSLARCDETAA